MTYKESLTRAMHTLAEDPATCFIGYGLTTGGALGTLKGVNREQLVETTVAEGLMCGLAIGMALTGRKPVVYYERFDFVLNAADAIVNHLAKIELMSRGEFTPGVIIRVTIGNKKKPLFTGETHVQNFTDAFRRMVDFEVVAVDSPQEVAFFYRLARERQDKGQSTMIAEYKDLV